MIASWSKRRLYVFAGLLTAFALVHISILLQWMRTHRNRWGRPMRQKNVEEKYEFGSDVANFLNLTFMRETATTRERRSFTLTPWKIDAENPRSQKLNSSSPDALDVRWSMVVLVKSDSANILQRRVARWTWASFLYIDGVRMETIFIVGKGATAREEMGLLKENKKFGDTLQVNMKEKYMDVGFKTLAGMQWAATHFPHEWIYASSDDDIMPNLLQLQEKIDEMLEFVQNRTNSTTPKRSPMFCGYGCNLDPRPKRNVTSKWYFNETGYPLPKYPPYCNGGWYAMTVGQAAELYLLSRRLSYFWIDDVWITGFLRLKHFTENAESCAFCEARDRTIGLWARNPYKLAFSQTGDSDRLMDKWRVLAAEIYLKRYLFVNAGDG